MRYCGFSTVCIHVTALRWVTAGKRLLLGFPASSLRIVLPSLHFSPSDSKLMKPLRNARPLMLPSSAMANSTQPASLSKLAGHSIAIPFASACASSNAFPDIMGIYLPDDHAPVRNGMRVRHIMGFESGFSPEFTVYHPDTKGPKKITRGWRSLILALSGGGYFNFNQACRLFDVERGRGSYHWQREIRQLKRIK
jgi:hypothetical protein